MRDKKGRFAKGHKHTLEIKEKIGKKSKEFWSRPDYIAKNKFSREKRICRCGCNKEFECKFNSKQKFIHGHNSRMKGYNGGQFKKGHIPWTKDKTKENDRRIFESSIKSSKSHKGKRTGKDSNFWKGGITSLRGLIRSLEEYKDWRTKVFKRDNYTCQECEKKGCYLEAHHIKQFAKLLQEFLVKYNQFSPIEDKEILVRLAITWKPFWDIANGQTLCNRCHNKTKEGALHDS